MCCSKIPQHCVCINCLVFTDFLYFLPIVLSLSLFFLSYTNHVTPVLSFTEELVSPLPLFCTLSLSSLKKTPLLEVIFSSALFCLLICAENLKLSAHTLLLFCAVKQSVSTVPIKLSRHNPAQKVQLNRDQGSI